jgi:hypothetical protein
VPLAAPDGYHAMTAAEGVTLLAGQTVPVFDAVTGALLQCRVHSFSNVWGWLVVPIGTESIAGIRLDVDDPDLWGDEDLESGRSRRGPQGDGGRFVALVTDLHQSAHAEAA